MNQKEALVSDSIQAAATGLSKQSVAILFAYNGSKYSGLERVKKSSLEAQINADKAQISAEKAPFSSVEEALFKAFPKDVVSLTHISRASLTSSGEHASKQVIRYF